MPSVTLHPRPQTRPDGSLAESPLPQLLQTPSGLALLEIQGTLNASATDLAPEDVDSSSSPQSTQTPIGRLVFPLYNPDALDPTNTAWMKRAYLYVGKHQRLTGEVKKLPQAIAIIRKRVTETTVGDIRMDDGIEEENSRGGDGGARKGEDELEIVDIVKHKILFASRPEPVGG